MFIKNTNMPLAQYTTFKQKKITKLLKNSVFSIIITIDIPTNSQILYSRFVNKIKNTGTDQAYEKSWLVVQAYNDQEIKLILIQLLTI